MQTIRLSQLRDSRTENHRIGTDNLSSCRRRNSIGQIQIYALKPIPGKELALFFYIQISRNALPAFQAYRDFVEYGFQPLCQSFIASFYFSSAPIIQSEQIWKYTLRNSRSGSKHLRSNWLTSVFTALLGILDNGEQPAKKIPHVVVVVGINMHFRSFYDLMAHDIKVQTQNQ